MGRPRLEGVYLPPVGTPIRIRLQTRDAICWLCGNYTKATLFYPRSAGGNCPGIGDDLTKDLWYGKLVLPDRTPRDAARAQVVGLKCKRRGDRWERVQLTFVEVRARDLYAHIRLAGFETKPKAGDRLTNVVPRRVDANGMIVLPDPRFRVPGHSHAFLRIQAMEQREQAGLPPAPLPDALAGIDMPRVIAHQRQQGQALYELSEIFSADDEDDGDIIEE